MLMIHCGLIGGYFMDPSTTRNFLFTQRSLMRCTIQKPFEQHDTLYSTSNMKGFGSVPIWKTLIHWKRKTWNN